MRNMRRQSLLLAVFAALFLALQVNINLHRNPQGVSWVKLYLHEGTNWLEVDYFSSVIYERQPHGDTVVVRLDDREILHWELKPHQ